MLIVLSARAVTLPVVLAGRFRPCGLAEGEIGGFKLEGETETIGGACI